MILRARWVLPISSPPIEDGAVRVINERIQAVGAWHELGEGAKELIYDLGDSILLPGLVNAHCHLDYTDMAGQLPQPRSFAEWIMAMLALKASWSYSDYAQSWLRGARMLLQHGVTTVADVEAVPELLPDVWHSTPLRVISFLELTSVRNRRPANEILNEAIQTIDLLPGSSGRIGLSPHAPYSTSGELLRLAGMTATQRGLPLMTHLGESRDEFEMFTNRRGVMFEWLKSQRNMRDCGLGTPVEHAEKFGLLGPNLLAIHGNYLGPRDAGLLAKRGVSVVHCPRSHAYFRHDPFPVAELDARGVNLSLGTDSLSTVSTTRRTKPQLDLFAEMRAFESVFPASSAERTVRMATINGARALGLEGAVGQLSPGAIADLISIPCVGKRKALFEAVIAHTGKVDAVFIGGQRVFGTV